MDANEREYIEELAHRIIGAAMNVSNELGPGFLEKVYENALALELQAAGLSIKQQASIPVRYRGSVVGEYFTDILVENCIIVELKCVSGFTNEHLAQCINYLKGTNLHLALLLNFKKPKMEFKRIVYNL